MEMNNFNNVNDIVMSNDPFMCLADGTDWNDISGRLYTFESIFYVNFIYTNYTFV